ncbi:DUF1360 domain-containing protein [Streptomyces lydicus]
MGAQVALPSPAGSAAVGALGSCWPCTSIWDSGATVLGAPLVPGAIAPAHSMVAVAGASVSPSNPPKAHTAPTTAAVATTSAEPPMPVRRSTRLPACRAVSNSFWDNTSDVWRCKPERVDPGL